VNADGSGKPREKRSRPTRALTSAEIAETRGTKDREAIFHVRGFNQRLIRVTRQKRIKNASEGSIARDSSLLERAYVIFLSDEYSEELLLDGLSRP